MNEQRSSQLRRQRDEARDRVVRLEDELKKAQHSVFRKRKEIRLLIKQLAEWKADHTPDVARVKELKGLKTTLRSERYIKGVELERIRSALCDDPECDHCRRVEAAMPDGGPFRSEPPPPTQQIKTNQPQGEGKS
ncbi:MAG TPA: hypothetical protein VI039_13160 [Solirubrobacterales bacterium]